MEGKEKAWIASLVRYVLAVLFITEFVLLLLAIIEPVYTFRGGLSGYYAIARYQLIWLGNAIHTPLLDSMTLFSLPVLYSAVMDLISGAYLVARLNSYSLDIASGSIASTIVSVMVARASLHPVMVEIRDIIPISSVKTSAGVIRFPRTITEIGRGMDLLNYAFYTSIITILALLGLTLLVTLSAKRFLQVEQDVREKMEQ